MFTWLQTNLQKHFRVVFIILLGGVIVAFVFTVGEMPGLGGGGRGRGADITYFDQELNTVAKRESFIRKARLSAYLNAGFQQFPDAAIENYAFNRATALYLANTHSIPNPNKEQLKEFVQSFPSFQDAEGNFSPLQYNSFIDMMDATGGENRANIAAVLEEEWRIKKVQDAISGPGFVLESEVLDVMKAEQTLWDVSVAELDLSTYAPEIDSSDEKLETFFVDNDFRYATPERRTVSYVSFDASDYLSQVEVTEDKLRAYYSANTAKYQRVKESTKTEAKRETEDIPFEEVKDRVEVHYKLEKTRELAQRDAQELVLEIVRNEVSFESDAFSKTLKNHGKEVQTTAPFSVSERPVGTSWSRNAINTAFKLNASRYYSEPLLEGDSALVLFLKNQIESSIPTLAEVKEQVRKDFIDEETRRLQVAYGEELQEKLKQESKDAFKAIAEENGMTVKTFSDFTLLEPQEGLEPSIAYSIVNYTVGQVSPMNVRGGKGIFVYVNDKQVPEISADNEDYAERYEQLKEAYKASALQQYIGALTQAERIRIGLAPSNS